MIHLELFDLPGPRPDDLPDPIHNGIDIIHGIDAAERYLKFTLQDFATLFRHCRPAAFRTLVALGADMVKLAKLGEQVKSFDYMRHRGADALHFQNPHALLLCKLLREAKAEQSKEKGHIP